MGGVLTSGPGRVGFGVFEADLKAGELRKSGSRVKLEGQPFQVLAMLLERPGEVVTREELQRKLWPADTFVDFEHSINAAVKRLRDALDDSADSPRYIETLPRRGYRFIYPINGGSAVAAQQPSATPRFGWQVKTLLIALPVVLIGIVAFNVGGLRHRIFGIAPGTIGSVLVSPAKNYTGDPAQEFLADGLTDSLTTHLAQVGALRVPSVTSAMFYKAERKKLPEIAKELKVDAVVEPSVQRSGAGLLINIQLIHARTDNHLWAKHYESTGQDLQAVLGRIARDVVAAMKVTPRPEERSRLARPKETSPEAYALFMQGRYHLRKGTEESREKAAHLFAKVIELDPNYAPAYAQLALLHTHGGAYLAGPGVTARNLALKWAEKALELDDSLAEAHTALANVSKADWNFKEVEARYKRAIELNPSFPTAHTWYSQFLTNLRRYDEALEHSRRAMELAPAEPSTLTHAAIAFWASGRTDEAMAYWQKVVDLELDYWGAYSFLGRGYVRQGKYAEAIAALEKTIALRGRDNISVACLAHAYAKAGRRDESLRLVAELESKSKKSERPMVFAMAIAYAGLGDEKKLFDLLERSYEGRGSGIVPLNSEQLFEDYQGDPRFRGILLRIGMPPESLAPLNTLVAKPGGRPQRK
ncbi:MAG: winged helix-turn-helix domain-containing protein [Acidobacteria bacterium]|nr:winged helix-turn-helix domain-containing protein [Acidobacteriota bacterium]MCL5286635.1 winged helix-turn-helix domain-containing protein [Acidobacteriota bacterium]